MDCVALLKQNRKSHRQSIRTKILSYLQHINSLLKGLEQQGLIQRQRAKTDERQVVLNFTEQGQQKCEQSLICMNIIQKFDLRLE
ncbi:transcriptional regulator, SarA/Rot family [Volucribacter amazonae]|uniref:Transcriptional regulator SarA/SarZ/Rot-like helix-turn-helix domain-containing protein n=1 Tax=Volucribacter amazonae TaxID=256731 RepID=A0A9X4SIF5_9PAST|nr:hypothetical protein [Volucribacter amazonae]